MTRVKALQIAPIDLSATFLAVRAQGGGLRGSFFLVSVRPDVGISTVDGAVAQGVISSQERVGRLDLPGSIYGRVVV